MKKCKQGYYYCYSDKKCKRIPLGYRVASSGYLRKENGEDSGENGENGENTNGNGNGGGVSESKSGDSSLRDWFGKSRSSDGKPGWVQLGGKYAGKPCAKQPGQTTKPKCGSSKMAAKLDYEEENKAFNRKQRQDPNPDRKGKAINVKTEETVVEKAGEKDACYKKVKSRYSVWPSAYASGALVKCRKKGAANWGNKSESVEYSDWRDDFKATEYEFIDIIKAEPLVSEGAMPDAIDPTAHNKARKQKKIRYMTQSPNKNEAEVARRMSKGPSLPMEEVETVDELKCWKGFKRKKGSIPGAKGSCVKAHAELEGEHIEERKDDTEIGFTGKPIPKKNWKSPGRRHEFEKKRREAGFTSTGSKYKSDVNPYYNPLQKNHVELEGDQIEEEKEESKIDGSNLKKLAAKAVRRVDADVDGDVDTDDMKSSETGEFVPSPDGKKLKPKVRFEGASDWRSELGEAIDKSKMKCNSPKSQAVGDSQTGKSHVVKACEGGNEKIIRFGQRGVKGSPKKEGESKEYASRRNRFKTRHAKNISKGKMSAAYWSNKVKW